MWPMPMSNRVDDIRHRTNGPFDATRMRPIRLADDTSSFFFPATTAFRRAAFAANLRWRYAAFLP
jgi:hypothetical protein